MAATLEDILTLIIISTLVLSFGLGWFSGSNS